MYVDSHNKATSLQAWPIVKVCRIAHRWKVGATVLAAAAACTREPCPADASLRL